MFEIDNDYVIEQVLSSGKKMLEGLTNSVIKLCGTQLQEKAKFLLKAAGVTGEKLEVHWYDGVKTMDDLRTKCKSTIDAKEFSELRTTCRKFKEDTRLISLIHQTMCIR